VIPLKCSDYVRNRSGRVEAEMLYLRAFAVGLVSGLIVLWIEGLALLASELHGWTGAYVVTGWFIVLVALIGFAIGFYGTVRRGRRSQRGPDCPNNRPWRALCAPAGAFLMCLATGSAINWLFGFELSMADGIATSTVVAIFTGYSTQARRDR
jgi:hypothetical protein